jgi:hypothetical protein
MFILVITRRVQEDWNTMNAIEVHYELQKRFKVWANQYIGPTVLSWLPVPFIGSVNFVRRKAAGTGKHSKLGNRHNYIG